MSRPLRSMLLVRLLSLSYVDRRSPWAVDSTMSRPAMS
jgi:hypothetical protein